LRSRQFFLASGVWGTLSVWFVKNGLWLRATEPRNRPWGDTVGLTAMPHGRGPAGWPTVLPAMFTDFPAAVALVTGPDLVVQAANDRYLALAGCAELAGRPLPEALPEFGAQEIVGLFRQVLASGEPACRHELPAWTGHRHGRPERVFVDAVYQPVKDEAGVVTGVLFLGTDVTARVTARNREEKELATAGDGYRTLFDALPFGVIHYSADGLILQANLAASQISGTPAQDLLTWPLPAAEGAVREDGTPLAADESPLKVALSTGKAVVDAVVGVPGPPDGGLRWLKVTAVPYRPDQAGQPPHGYVMFRDVTEQRHRDAALRDNAELMSRLRDANVLGVVTIEGGRIVEANDAYLDFLGHTREDLEAGRLDWQAMIPPEWAAAMERAAAQLRATGAFRPFEKECLHRDGHRVPVLIGGALVGRDPLRWTAYVVDLSARRRAERARMAAAARERAARAEAQIARERLGFLIRAGELVSAAANREELLARAAGLVVPGLADLCVTFLPDDGGMLRATSVAHLGPADEAVVTDLRDFAIPRTGPLLVQAAWQDGRTIVKDSSAGLRARGPDFGSPLQEIVDWVDPQSVLAVPLMYEERALGVITLGRSAGRPGFAQGSDIPVLEELGRKLASGLANADRSAWDHAVAHALQRTLLPDALPRVAGLDLAARYLPATVGLDVGGDWYDVFAFGDGRVGLAVGDVVGHNLAAASVMGQVRNLLRGYAVDKTDPAAVLHATDAALGRLLPDALATVVYAVLDIASGQLSYASAGHPPPGCVTPAGEVSYLDDQPDAMLGLGGGFTTRHRRLAPGSTLLLYTDGLIEDRHRDLDDGLARLAAALRQAAARSAEQACAALQAAIVGTAPRADDLCMLAVRLAGGDLPG
jgi:PAS domain S-box-containing protein